MRQNQVIKLTVGRWVKIPGELEIKTGKLQKYLGWDSFTNAYVLIKSDGKKQK